GGGRWWLANGVVAGGGLGIPGPKEQHPLFQRNELPLGVLGKFGAPTSEYYNVPLRTIFLRLFICFTPKY
ncbi:hypothetical protein, partial [Enterobacter hormaechei]